MHCGYIRSLQVCTAMLGFRQFPDDDVDFEDVFLPEKVEADAETSRAEKFSFSEL